MFPQKHRQYVPTHATKPHRQVDGSSIVNPLWHPCASPTINVFQKHLAKQFGLFAPGSAHNFIACDDQGFTVIKRHRYLMGPHAERRLVQAGNVPLRAKFQYGFGDRSASGSGNYRKLKFQQACRLWTVRWNPLQIFVVRMKKIRHKLGRHIPVFMRFLIIDHQGRIGSDEVFQERVQPAIAVR